jgi:hypothetical protein
VEESGGLSFDVVSRHAEHRKQNEKFFHRD